MQRPSEVVELPKTDDYALGLITVKDEQFYPDEKRVVYAVTNRKTGVTEIMSVRLAPALRWLYGVQAELDKARRESDKLTDEDLQGLLDSEDSTRG